VKQLVVLVLVLGACVAETAAPPPETSIDELTAENVEKVELDTNGAICAAASELPAGELCSLVCDPDAFKARLLDGGMKGGNCYQVRCTLSPEMSVTVGVCLP